MPFLIRRPWDLPEREVTPEAVYANRRGLRREFLAEMALAALGAGLFAGCDGSDEDVRRAGAYEAPLPMGGNAAADDHSDGIPELPSGKPRRNPAFTYGRAESDEAETQRYANFYEFTTSKSVWRYVDKFQPLPWTVTIEGLCGSPRTFDLDTLHKEFPYEERCYRHRCVETWAMCVPWAGFPLRDLLAKVDPKPEAKYVEFETLNRPSECPNLATSFGRFPWPYTEALTLKEAMNELAFLATGLYGHQLPKQNGAPFRLVVPWKYGFKSIKSITHIRLVDERPLTFWNTVAPDEYAFQANVDPEVPHPRWSQRTEWMLGTRERHETRKYNGYGEYVSGLYT